MNRLTEKVTVKTDTSINIGGLEDLRELVSGIPEGTVFSVDLSEVISIGQEDG